MAKLPDSLARSLHPPGQATGTRRMNTWQSVRADVMERIRAREWLPGELIPTEQELAVELGCARATVNRALRELADSGIVERRRKVGTRVAATPSRRATLEMPLMRHEIEATGATYGYRMTSYEITMPTQLAQRALQLEHGKQAILIKTQFLADGRPHCCEAVWLNAEALPDLQRKDLESLPPQEWLARNLPLTRGKFTILAQGASGDCATNLEVPEGTPVLTIERLNWTDATPISYARQFYRPEHRLVSE